MAHLRLLAARLGAAVGLLAEESGGGSFDEACSVPWLRLSRLYPRAELPLACLATTVELGGQADTTVQQAEANAAAILAFLAEQGFVEGEWPAAPEACCEGLPFEGTGYVHAPHTGVVSFLRRPGEWVEAGEPLFQVIDPWPTVPAPCAPGFPACFSPSNGCATRSRDSGWPRWPVVNRSVRTLAQRLISREHT